MMRKILLGMFIGLAGLGAYAGYLFSIAGQFKTITNQFAGTCKPVRGVAGAEDIVIQQATGQAFIAAVDRRAMAQGTPPHGAIWGYDLTTSPSRLINLTPALPFGFSAHGLGLLAEGGGGTLMAVNHGSGGVFDTTADTIEVFDIGFQSLTHRATIKGAALKAVNDVVPVGNGRFYATIDHHYTGGIMRTIEDYARLALASVVYYDGKNFRTVADGFRYANGINISHDGKQVYVAATTDSAISVFDRDEQSGALSNRRTFPVGTGVDNIDVDADGVLWVAAHAKLLDFVAHSKDASKKSASQVFTLTPNGDGTFDRTEIYMNDGTQLSGSSVAAHTDDRLLIGSVFDPHFLDCKLP